MERPGAAGPRATNAGATGGTLNERARIDSTGVLVVGAPHRFPRIAIVADVLAPGERFVAELEPEVAIGIARDLVAVGARGAAVDDRGGVGLVEQVANLEGQPVLVGTTSIEKNEFLSELLKKKRISHSLLNAKNHEREAEIIADGFEWSEGPLWLEKQQALIFSDVPMNTIYKWTEANGKEVYLCLDWWRCDS